MLIAEILKEILSNLKETALYKKKNKAFIKTSDWELLVAGELRLIEKALLLIKGESQKSTEDFKTEILYLRESDLYSMEKEGGIEIEGKDGHRIIIERIDNNDLEGLE